MSNDPTDKTPDDELLDQIEESLQRASDALENAIVLFERNRARLQHPAGTGERPPTRRGNPFFVDVRATFFVDVRAIGAQMEADT